MAQPEIHQYDDTGDDFMLSIPTPDLDVQCGMDESEAAALFRALARVLPDAQADWENRAFIEEAK